MNKIVLLITCICIAIPRISLGQNSLFQDSNGKSSIKLFQNNFTLNTGSKSLEISLDNISRESGSLFNRTAFAIKLNSNEGKANIYNKGDLILDGGLSIYKGFKYSSMDSPFSHEFYISGNILFNRDKVFDLSKPDDILEIDTNTGVEIQTGYFGYGRFMIYGISVNAFMKNNSHLLKQSNIREVTLASGNPNVELITTDEAYDVNEYLSDATGYDVLADFAFDLRRLRTTIFNQTNPEKLLATYVAVLLRYNTTEGSSSEFSPAIGYYVGKEGSPKSIRIGVSWQFINLLGKDNEDPVDNSVVSISAGFPF